MPYTDISWDNLLSEDELTFYSEELRRYNENPEYRGSGEKPPDPVANPEYDGMHVRLPGYAVGVDTVPGEYNKSSTFLFVPFQGACIHVPAPPPNQTVFVEMDKAVSTDPYTPIYLEGTLHVETGENELAAFFYRIKGDTVRPYEG